MLSHFGGSCKNPFSMFMYANCLSLAPKGYTKNKLSNLKLTWEE
jgi:hypothetical protein